MLHNTLTVAEWANRWEGMCISTEGLQNYSSKWLENYFSDEQNKKMLKLLYISI